MKHDVTVELAGGKQLHFETGRMAKQASGAALVTQGDSVVLATAVASPDPREGIDFFPLTVDYREYAYAGGRIPGGFIKREGRPSEREVLTSRQIDRPIRPLFPEGFRNETQVIALVFSADKENDPDVIGINAASAALALSDVPFNGPVGAVRIGHVNGEFVVNPSYAEREISTLNITIVGTSEGIVMVESGSKQVSEELVADAIDFAHVEIKKIVSAIHQLVALAGKPKRKVTVPEFDQCEYFEALKAKIGERLKRRRRHQDTWQVRELCADQADQGRAGEGAAGGRRRRQEEAREVLRGTDRAYLPRPGDQGTHSPRPPRV